MTPSDDGRLMGLALALGRRHLGLAWPNPSVGAAVVEPASGRILATAVTGRGGRPHAEPVALAAAGAAARGATLYVSLEPCSHHGRTPPCVDAIIGAGIARVVSALADPDPRVAGRGHARLREAGIAVEIGIGAEDAARDHRGHVTRVREGRPFLTCKLAATADGFAGPAGGPRLLITGEAANARTHMMRAHADAVMVGISTVLADDPRLDVRLPGLEERRPVRIVVDSRLRLPPGGRFVSEAGERPCWVLCTEAASAEAEARLVAAGAIVLRAPADAGGRVDLAIAMHLLAERGLTRVLCEGGPALADALAASDLIDEAVVITSDRALGAPGRPAIGPNLARLLARLPLRDREQVGSDRMCRYERPAPCSPAS